tara:strand:- start:257 stop:550 length:294 start_codon:yes stop_codon:yes gene_type:complete
MADHDNKAAETDFCTHQYMHRRARRAQIMRKALADTAEILAVPEDEVIQKYRDVMLGLAQGAALDMAAGIISDAIGAGAERIATAIGGTNREDAEEA